MATPVRDATGSAQHAPFGEDLTSTDSFMVLKKPFDDAKNPPHPRSYPKDLDTTSLIEEPSHEDPPHEREERDSCRPWPQNNGSFEPSERGHESYPSPSTKSSITDATPLQRWKDEPAVQGRYHGIDSGVMGNSAKTGRKGKREASSRTQKNEE